MNLYNYLKNLVDSKVSNKVLSENIIKVMKVMLPFTPHLANECLELFKCNNSNKWPELIKKNMLEEVKIAIQINGKTRDVITIKKDLAQQEIQNIILDLKSRGIGVLITDHNVRETLSITDRSYLLYDGKVLFSGTIDNHIIG